MKLELFKTGEENSLVNLLAPELEINSAVEVENNFYTIHEELELDQLSNFGSCTSGLGMTTFLPFEDTKIKLSI